MVWKMMQPDGGNLKISVVQVLVYLKHLTDGVTVNTVYYVGIVDFVGSDQPVDLHPDLPTMRLSTWTGCSTSNIRTR